MSPWARSSFIYAYPTLLALSLFLDNLDYKLTALVSNLVLFFFCLFSLRAGSGIAFYNRGPHGCMNTDVLWRNNFVHDPLLRLAPTDRGIGEGLSMRESKNTKKAWKRAPKKFEKRLKHKKIAQKFKFVFSVGEKPNQTNPIKPTPNNTNSKKKHSCFDASLSIVRLVTQIAFLQGPIP